MGTDCAMGPFRAFAGTCLAAALMVTAMSSGRALTEDQMNKALEIEASASSERSKFTARGSVGALPGLASTPAGKSGKSVRPLVAPVESAGGDLVPRGTAPAEPQRAMVMRYDYATGVTTRTTVDLGSGQALDVRADTNYPTPLAQEELDQAVALARQKVGAFDAILKEARPEDVSISHLSPLDNDTSSATYGHRLVYLWVSRPKRSEQILVDLSTNEVILDHH
jgi:hypothetical protein